MTNLPPQSPTSTEPATAATIAPVSPVDSPTPRLTHPLGVLSVNVLAVLGLAGATGNIAVRTDFASVASLLAVAATALCLWLAGCAPTRLAQGGLAAAVVIAAWLPLRASTWLAHLNSWTSAALLLAVALFGRAGLPRFVASDLADICRRVAGLVVGPSMITRSVLPGRNRPGVRAVLPIIRGVALAVLPVLILGAILASADAVFASALRIDVEAGTFVGHLTLTLVVAALVAGLVCVSRSTIEKSPDRGQGRASTMLGAVEAIIILGSVAVLFGLFAVTQLWSALADNSDILAAADITPSEYAREGFFQLLLVATLTLMLVVTIRAFSGGHTRLDIAQRVAAGTVAVLTILIVAVSIIRLDLYTDAFGQTTLRWYSATFAWLLGVVFVLLALRQVVVSRQPWFGGGAFLAVLVALLAVNVVNPEARVAEHNLTRTALEAPLDSDYLTQLSADAWPTLLRHRETLEAPGVLRWDTMIEDRCLAARERSNGYGPLGWNFAASRVECPG